MWDPYALFEKRVLDNGLTVYAAQWPNVSWEYVGVIIHAGAAKDPVGREGTAHFVEHLVSANTLLTFNKIIDFIKSHGGYANLGKTNFFYSTYHFFSPTEKKTLAKMLGIYAHMLFSAKLEKCVENERKIIVGEFNQEFPNDTRYKMRMRAHQALYHGYWMERMPSALGSPESIQAIRVADLQLFYDTYYNPHNMSLVALGGLAIPEIVKMISENGFGLIKTGAVVPLPRPVTSIAPPKTNLYTFKFSEEIGTGTSLNASGYETTTVIPGNFSYREIILLRNMLQERLFKEIRERRKLAYRVDVSWQNLLYFYYLNINCPGLAWSAMDSIADLIDKEIDKIGDEEKLFQKVKNNRLRSLRMQDLSGDEVLDEVLDDLQDSRKITTLTESVDRYAEITLDDIRQILPFLRRRRRWSVILRP